jgi:hypothetical protein
MSLLTLDPPFDGNSPIAEPRATGRPSIMEVSRLYTRQLSSVSHKQAICLGLAAGKAVSQHDLRPPGLHRGIGKANLRRGLCRT